MYKLQLTYDEYLDRILGGWIGKSMGGAIGVPYEGYKGWIEISPDSMFPAEMPANDDLDLQVLWLHVLEQKGLALRSDDLAAAWLEHCWYPFNEYGIFRRNWRLGIHPPMSGAFTNQFWETGMGCPIRAEIWGYVFPGAPDLAARFAAMDGVLDHTYQSTGAEMMFAAMASMAFVVPDIRRLIAMSLSYLPPNTPIERLTHAAIAAYDEELGLRDAYDRLMALEGHPEACDSQVNVPFTILGLLYGGGDLQETMLKTLRCGYDTDCTLATAGALLGQILGAKRIPQALKQQVGDELVMGIQYRRPEMTLTALARDTARVGVLFAQTSSTAVEILGAPAFAPFPDSATPAPIEITVTYDGLPAAAPGDLVAVQVHVDGSLPAGAQLAFAGPAGWTIVPATAPVDDLHRSVTVQLHAPRTVTEWPMQNLFTARVKNNGDASLCEYSFGIAGAGLWQFLGVYYDPLPDETNAAQRQRKFQQHFTALDRQYLEEPHVDAEAVCQAWSHKLGQPAIICSYEHDVAVSSLVGLRGAYCVYLERTVIVPDERAAYLVIGNNDSYRVYLNDELVGEADEMVWWAPFNNVHAVTLQAGPNRLLLKLIKQRDELRFTLGIRQQSDDSLGQNKEDWMIDLADAVPSMLRAT